MMTQVFSGQVAVVTGAGSGIGADVARHLHENGASVHLIARTPDNVKKVCAGLEAKGRSATAHIGDVCDESHLVDIRDAIVGKDKKIDILVTCAAAPAAAGPTESLDFADWRTVLATDLDGVFLCCKVFGKSMIENRYGRIVNLTSFHNIATYPNRAAYNAAKSGVKGITRALAVEWGHYGITVNAVAPGPIRTPRTSWFLSQSPDVEKGMLDRTPNVRLGEVEDVAALVGFLAAEPSKHVSGQEIVIDGGWTKNAWWGGYTDLQ